VPTARRRRFAGDIRSVFSLTLTHASPADVRNAQGASEPRLGTRGCPARGVRAHAQGLGPTHDPRLGYRNARPGIARSGAHRRIELRGLSCRRGVAEGTIEAGTATFRGGLAGESRLFGTLHRRSTRHAEGDHHAGCVGVAGSGGTPPKRPCHYPLLALAPEERVFAAASGCGGGRSWATVVRVAGMCGLSPTAGEQWSGALGGEFGAAFGVGVEVQFPKFVRIFAPAALEPSFGSDAGLAFESSGFGAHRALLAATHAGPRSLGVHAIGDRSGRD